MPARPLVRIALLLSGIALCGSAVASSAQAAVKVEKAPAVIERKTFDPDRPPTNMPPLKDGELAVTASSFECSAQVTYTPRRREMGNGNCRMTYHIDGLVVKIALHVTVWLPENAPDKLKAHEEGHREISERFYANAEKAAKLAGEKLDGRNIEATAPDCEKAASEKLAVANRGVAESFLKQVSAPSTRVQNIYDEVTAHGTRPVDEATAIKQAIAQQAEEAKQAEKTAPRSGATTRPTTPRR